MRNLVVCLYVWTYLLLIFKEKSTWSPWVLKSSCSFPSLIVNSMKKISVHIERIPALGRMYAFILSPFKHFTSWLEKKKRRRNRKKKNVFSHWVLDLEVTNSCIALSTIILLISAVVSVQFYGDAYFLWVMWKTVGLNNVTIVPQLYILIMWSESYLSLYYWF
jgi:hypothetical protein